MSGFSRELLPLPCNPERIAAEAAPARAPSERSEAGSGVVRVLVAGARAPDLQRRVVDAEPLVELVRDAGEERIVVAGLHTAQVRGPRTHVPPPHHDMQRVARTPARLRPRGRPTPH